jgi:biofilm PGA synthesis N-glycosyltransferase PgaC
MVMVFWISCALVAYVYLGYPLLLACWARLRPKPVITGSAATRVPYVSIVIAARNEGSRLSARIENLLQLDYPPSRRQIIVVSDGSTDDTLSVLSAYSPVVEPVAVEAGGKALALNAGAARAAGDLLVFADARQAFAPDALIELVAPFQDPLVGVVSGELLLDSESPGRRTGAADRRGGAPDRAGIATPRPGRDPRRGATSTIADGISLYWRYEKSIRRHESAVGSTLGATGAIYAMRRSLWRDLPAGTILDDVVAPMRAALMGYRVVFTDRARAFDRAAPDARSETRRKIRTLAGNYQLLWLLPALLVPWRNPAWLQLLSHKLGRLIVPYALVALIASSIALAGRAAVYAAAMAAQSAFYLLACYGAWLDGGAGAPRPSMREPARGRPFPLVGRAARVAFTFVVMNYSAVAGLVAALTWKEMWR